MNWPSVAMLGLAYGISEAALSVFKRSGTTSPDVDRSSLRVPWVVILCGVAVAITAATMLPAAGSSLLARWYSFGVALFAAGLVLRWYAIVYLGRFFTVDVAIAADHRVVDSGPYRLVRHPSYAGALLAFLGLGICYGNWVSLVAVTLPIAWAFMQRIEVEESALGSALGESYAAYARRTRRLVPYLY
jgi:protein-S-isoprenylcysteine O-methyltransferase